MNRENKFTHLKEISLFKKVFSSNSYEIMQYLNKDDIISLKMSNKYLLDICECHSLFITSIQSLDKLFLTSIDTLYNTNPKDNNSNSHTINITEKKSKFKEKYNFNKPMNEYYKGSDKLNQRIQSAKKKK